MPTVGVELNFYYMHYNDACAFAQWAREKSNGAVNPSIYVRHSILSAVFASEALINRVLVEFSSDASIFEMLEKSSIQDKWLLAPYLCAKGTQPKPFDKGTEPMQSFRELVQIRNWLAHPKVDNYFDATLDPKSTISTGASSEAYPWLEILKGKAWKQTAIPKNPFELDHSHAASAIRIVDAMVDALQMKLGDQMQAGWLDLITVRGAQGIHSYKAPVHSIWGGYGGASG